jgi:GTP cyclohydrolase I
MNAPEKFQSCNLPDVQSSRDTRRLAIQQVGIKDFKHPVMVQTANGPQPSVATIEMTVALPAEEKGTHMSRFIEVFQNHEEALDFASLNHLMDKMLERLDAQEGAMHVAMPYFVRKTAPVSAVASMMDYEIKWSTQVKAGQRVTTLTVVVPVTSLCPCSKNISDYGAHNQRSHVTISAELGASMSVESLIGVAEKAASCELWGLLKRPDEKYVTERAYDNPKFVEDLVRDVAMALAADDRISAFTVESENFESIHNHSAYARIEHRAAAQA